jgi:putative flippase GtrA
MKKNLVYSLIVGFLTSWFLIFIIKNPFIEEFRNLAFLGDRIWWLLLIMPAIFFLGMVAAQLLSRLVSVFLQLVKFAEVGVLNTAIDFGVLNLLIWLTGITSGWAIAPLNVTSFLCATTNSYFWNKFWTFKKKGAVSGGEFTQFLIISAVGIGVNTGIVVAGTSLVSPALGMSPAAWANVMKLLATLVSLTWNFLGYKFIVFKAREVLPPSN